MVKYTETTIVVKNEVESVTCDVCGLTTSEEVVADEFIYIRHVGGYGNPIGDGQVIECDICPTCLKEKLGKHLRDDKGKKLE